MPLLVLLLAISSLAIAAVAFHSDNTSTHNQSDSDGMSSSGGTTSVITSSESSETGYCMFSGAPIIPQLIHSDLYVIYTSLTAVDSDSFSIDLSPRMDIRNCWMTVSHDASPYDVPDTVGIFETALEGSVCTFSSGESSSGKGDTLLSVPVMYRTTQPDGGSMQILWLLDVHFIDTLINSEGSFHVS